MSWTLILVGAIFTVAGMLLKLKPPKEINPIYGYRTKRSMSSERLWKIGQEEGGKNMAVSGCVLMILGLILFVLTLPEWAAVLILIVSLVGTCVGIFVVTEGKLREHE